MSLIKGLLLSFCQACNSSFFGHGIRNSTWLFPFVEIFHLLALGILGGTIIVLNMRLMGIWFHSDRTAELAREVRCWMVGALMVMLISGFLLFSTEAVKMYGNWAFRLKMLFLALASLYTFTIYRKVTEADDSEIPRLWRIVAAVVSFILWAGVGLGGRAIGYVT